MLNAPQAPRLVSTFLMQFLDSHLYFPASTDQNSTRLRRVWKNLMSTSAREGQTLNPALACTIPRNDPVGINALKTHRESAYPSVIQH